MRVAVLNGSPDPSRSSLDAWLAGLRQALEARGDVVDEVVLRELDLRTCTGCLNCWFTSPGECSSGDASHVPRRAVVRSDVALWASPVRMGFTSALLKRATDKLVPVALPHLRVREGEFHHPPRYRRRPAVGVVLACDGRGDPEDLAIIDRIYRRIALDLDAPFAFTVTTERPPEEVLHALDGAERLAARP